MNRDLVLSWKGEERTFSPTFRFLRRVDAKLQSDPDRPGNLFQTALTIHKGGSAIMDVPIAMSLFLKEAGFDVSEEECWHIVSVITSKEATDEQRADYANFGMAITQAILPEMDLGKNPEAPAPEAPESRGEQKSQALTGQAAI